MYIIYKPTTHKILKTRGVRFVEPTAHDLASEAEEQMLTEEQVQNFPEEWTPREDDTIKDESESSDEQQRVTRRVTSAEDARH